MKINDQQLDRLLRAAAKAPGQAIGPPTTAVEYRTLAAWRSATTVDTFVGMLPWLRRGLFLSGTAAACALALALSADRSGTVDEEIETPDAVFTLALSR
ncbi:MAG: hypothetical protein EXS36_13150 [Pedosphaera sp.]|nr:hypothetical protein [Pedosphaera sp.]